MVKLMNLIREVSIEDVNVTKKEMENLGLQMKLRIKGKEDDRYFVKKTATSMISSYLKNKYKLNPSRNASPHIMDKIVPMVFK